MRTYYLFYLKRTEFIIFNKELRPQYIYLGYLFLYPYVSLHILQMKILLVIALLAVTTFSFKFHWWHHQPPLEGQPNLSMFYCGFSGEFCGQSSTDDVHEASTTVILAFVNSNVDGSVTIDADHFPHAQVKQWKGQGKKILISVGGQNGNWNYIFASGSSVTAFTNSLVQIVNQYQLDGVDLDIESYQATPRTVANAIIQLKKALGNKLLVVSPECVTVYQGSPDYSPDTPGQPFNYFVNIIRLADDYIDFYQPQAYNNWYDVPGGTLDYLKNVYLNWRNLPAIVKKPIPNFNGVRGDKLLIGVLASTKAGGAAYFYAPDVVSQFRSWLVQNNYPLRGFMIWDSHWDSLNGNAIAKACTK